MKTSSLVATLLVTVAVSGCVALTGFKNRISVLFNWTVAFLSDSRAQRVITKQQVFARQAMEGRTLVTGTPVSSPRSTASTRQRSKALSRWSNRLTVVAAIVLAWHGTLDNAPAQLSSVMARSYEVATARRSDFHVRRDVRARMDELGFTRRQIGVFVISGRVSLRGRVHSWAEAQRAIAAARNVAGVRMVVNDLNVSGQTRARLARQDGYGLEQH